MLLNVETLFILQTCLFGLAIFASNDFTILSRQPVISTKAGKVRGRIGTDMNGNEIFRFTGIPYAEPPVGHLRFKASIPKRPWNGILDATQPNTQCVSRNDSGIILGSEDCLYLNVYSRKHQWGTLKPVMVFIHGGGYTFGGITSQIYGPEFLLTEDVVLVVIAYRLGLLGFLSLDDIRLEVPGNNGLKDQALALKWVQKNIINFNGDPKRVTLFGESAGSASTHFHVVSPYSKGLFHKAILESGCVLNSWPWGRTNGLQAARNTGKHVKTEKEALEILKSLSVDELILAQEKLGDSYWANYRRPYGPIVEKPNKNAFLTENPLDILKRGEQNQVPMIIGYNSKEGRWVNDFLFSANVSNIKTPPFSWDYLIPWQTGVKMGSKISERYASILESLYTPDTEEENIINAWSDSVFEAGIFQSIKFHLQTSPQPIYTYRVSVNSSLNFLKREENELDKPGVFHADELGYIFKQDDTPDILPGSLEDISWHRFVKLWTNFAKYGNPTPTKELGVIWSPSNTTNPLKVLDIGENLTLRVAPERERFFVWNRILEKSPYIIY